MAARPGIDNSRTRRQSGRLLAAGRLLGFTTLAGLSLALMAAVILIPQVARHHRTRHRLAYLENCVADTQKQVRANERLIAALPDDEILTERLAMSQLGLLPTNELVYEGQRRRLLRPIAPIVKPTAQPQPPANAWLMRAAKRIENPGKRRGLLIVAFGLMTLALFMFAHKPEPQPR